MKSKLRFLFVGVVLMSIVSGGSALAAPAFEPVDYGLGEWEWSGDGTYINFSFINSTSSHTFDLVNSKTNENITLLDDEHNAAILTVNSTVENGKVSYYSALTSFIPGVGPANIQEGSITGQGVPVEFGFKFYNGSVHSTAYYVYQSNETTYTLTSADRSMAVMFSTPSTTNFSAVPIPGSALLLASSLLGLIGIGSRKNKA